MNETKPLKKFWNFLNSDGWLSTLVTLVLLILIIKFVFFPLLSFTTGSPLPLVVVQSCSMYHEVPFDEWWQNNLAWYENQGITKEEFREFPIHKGLTKGDVIFVWGRSSYEKGDIIIFNPNEEALAPYPIIHRVVSENPIATKGDHNLRQLSMNNNIHNIDETNIPEERIIGKSVFR